MNRRSFLGTFFFFLLFIIAIPLHRTRLLFNRLRQTSFPDGHELKTLAALSEHIFPQDKSPGAKTLDIESFLALQCKTEYFISRIPSLKRIINYADTRSHLSNYPDFISAPPEFQKQVIEHITADIYYPEIRNDFQTMIDITIEGCFASPVHGGNRQKQAWQLLNDSINEEWFYA